MFSEEELDEAKKRVEPLLKKQKTEELVISIVYEELYNILVKPLDGMKAVLLNIAINKWSHIVLQHYISYIKYDEMKELRKNIIDIKKANVLLKNHIKTIREAVENPILCQIIRPKLSWMNGKIQGDPFEVREIELYGEDVDIVPVSTGVTYNTMSAILKDLVKLQDYTKSHRGSLDIYKAMDNCDFYIIDESYLKFLYFVPKYDYKVLILKDILHDMQHLDDDFSGSEMIAIKEKLATSLKKIHKVIEYKKLVENLL